MQGKQKNSLFRKMLRSLTFSRDGHTKNPARPYGFLTKSKSFDSATTSSCRASIKDGCFAVYVGPEKQKFVVKTEYVNHPLFRMLLEDAELEYGFNSEGPILLPCDVDSFYRILAEMDSPKETDNTNRYGCGFAYGSCSPFNPTRRLGANDYGSYEVLTPNRLPRWDYC